MKRFIRLGDMNDVVCLVQKRLNVLGFYDGKMDGIFGKMTENAVIAFQVDSKLNADGVVGPTTWLALNLPPHLVVTNKVPHGEKELYDTFGDPLEPGYWLEYGGFCVTPQELDHVFTYEYLGRNGFWCSKLVMLHFQKAFDCIISKGLSDKLKTFNGCYNVRYIRGRRKLSTHAWGISIYLNASTNLLGTDGDMDKGVVECFEDNGFVWGGNFARKDPMHFQYVSGY